MKKSIIALSLLSVSQTGYAVENGKPELASEFPSLVTMNCTGTIIAGKWVMTAAHCNENFVDLVGSESHNGSKSISVKRRIKHDEADFALWELTEPSLFNKALFLSRIHVSNDKYQRFNLYGFGQTGIQLNSAEYKVFGDFTSPEILDLEATSLSNSIPGDSGSPIINSNGKIIATHKGANAENISTSRISYVADFILSTIDGWHHQTIGTVAAGKSTTIEVQSLHVNPVIDSASRTGDIDIDVANSSCIANGEQIQPFQTCTYTVTSTNGYEGTLLLGEGHTVIFNKGKSEPVIPPTPTPDEGGSSGGSLGFLSLLGLGIFSFVRRRTTV
ncbi:trypsin protease precursor [Shewanella sairae]|uniref:Trypsin protease n=1 Tax=Shewanella sairae TaxID=190310 RepID=A0ABQ4P5R9_9GAMM|nr:trypsin-like serine protease [Shewanella sairae]MCL1130486.1 trypsin-like serine protease [Shewanella sairae]GIU42897.1 trypsin protease precursor [Shewanella sairae]